MGIRGRDARQVSIPIPRSRYVLILKFEDKFFLRGRECDIRSLEEGMVGDIFCEGQKVTTIKRKKQKKKSCNRFSIRETQQHFITK